MGVAKTRRLGVCKGGPGWGVPRAQSVASVGLEAGGLGKGLCKQLGELGKLQDLGALDLWREEQRKE